MDRKTRGQLLLLLTAIIWGCAFVAQSVAMDSIGAWTFTCFRSFIAGIALLPVAFGGKKDNVNQKLSSQQKKDLIKSGFYCGILLAAATVFQQHGIIYTSVGKCGFITSLYVVIVPILETMRGKRFSKKLWGSVAMAVVGLYFLSINSESNGLEYGDLLVLISSLLFALHILVIDSWTKKVDPIAMSCLQFFFAGIVCIIPMLMFETINFETIRAAVWPLLYVGVISSGAGFTLQIIGQRDAGPSIASMLLSLESVFSALAGYIFLSQKLSLREIAGCVIMFVAIILAQKSEQGQNMAVEE